MFSLYPEKRVSEWPRTGENGGILKNEVPSGNAVRQCPGQYGGLRMKEEARKRLLEETTEERLWEAVLAYQGEPFHTCSGLPFTYVIRRGRGGAYTRELWIDRREESKSLAWSSVALAFRNLGTPGRLVPRPKVLGDIRGVSYIYGIFYRLGLITVSGSIEEKMRGEDGSTL